MAVNKQKDEELEAELREVFSKVDSDGSGSMEKEEFIDAVKNNPDVAKIVKGSRGLSHLINMEGDFSEAFNSLDGDGGGGVTFDEFLKFVKTELEEENIRNIFKAIDSDGNRFLTKKELVNAFKTNKQVIKLVQESSIFQEFIEQEDWDSVFAEIDRDHTGGGENKIDFPEFWKFCKKCNARADANRIKKLAKEKRIEFERQQSIRHKELLSRITNHISTNNGSSGTYLCSIVPDNVNFPTLPNGPNPYEPNAYSVSRRLTFR